jgi:hypothetical protein
MLSWDWTESLGKSGWSSVGKDGENDVKSWHLQGSCPWLCQLRTDVLTPMSKYWIYWSHAGDIGPVNWCSLFVNRWLTFTYCFNGYERRENGRRLIDKSIGVLGIVSGAFFLRAIVFIQLYWVCTKGCYIRVLPIKSIRAAYVDWCENHTYHLYQVSPVGCISIWIAVTLG